MDSESLPPSASAEEKTFRYGFEPTVIAPTQIERPNQPNFIIAIRDPTGNYVGSVYALPDPTEPSHWRVGILPPPQVDSELLASGLRNSCRYLLEQHPDIHLTAQPSPDFSIERVYTDSGFTPDQSTPSELSLDLHKLDETSFQAGAKHWGGEYRTDPATLSTLPESKTAQPKTLNFERAKADEDTALCGPTSLRNALLFLGLDVDQE